MFTLLTTNVMAEYRVHSSATYENIKKEAVKITTIELASLDDLIALFKEYNYTRESWQKGSR